MLANRLNWSWWSKVAAHAYVTGLDRGPSASHELELINRSVLFHDFFMTRVTQPRSLKPPERSGMWVASTCPNTRPLA